MPLSKSTKYGRLFKEYFNRVEKDLESGMYGVFEK
jgi:hypothetical protein